MLPVLFYGRGNKKTERLGSGRKLEQSKDQSPAGGTALVASGGLRARYCSWDAAQAPLCPKLLPPRDPESKKKDPKAVTKLEEQKTFRFNV